MLRSGDLNKRVDLQAPTRVSDGLGGFTTVWTTLRTINAAIWDATSNERNQASATTLIISHRIRIRYLSVLKSSWRIKFGNRYFAIVSIICPNEARKFLDLMCKEAS